MVLAKCLSKIPLFWHLFSIRKPSDFWWVAKIRITKFFIHHQAFLMIFYCYIIPSDASDFWNRHPRVIFHNAFWVGQLLQRLNTENLMQWIGAWNYTETASRGVTSWIVKKSQPMLKKLSAKKLNYKQLFLSASCVLL